MSTTKTIFVTGFPGFLAGRLVKKLASTDTRFFLLVQKQFFEKAVSDIALISSATGTPSKNFVILKGDITEPNLGLNPADLESVIEETTDIFHLAAIYDLEVKKDLAYSVNVEGTRNVNELAKRVENLTRYNYVSTCYVAGKRDDRIYENELEHDAGFRNYYEETKYFAELKVHNLKGSLPPFQKAKSYYNNLKSLLLNAQGMKQMILLDF